MSRVRMGVVVSASHNLRVQRHQVLLRGGAKLLDQVEHEMERLVQRDEVPRPEGAALGRITDSEDAAERYLGHLAGAAGGTLAGMRVVIDYANGRRTDWARRSSGASAPRSTRSTMSPTARTSTSAVVPPTLKPSPRPSGDSAPKPEWPTTGADRVILSDADGNVVDGDQILANLGFRKTMDEQDINVIETQVGDRYVLEEMLRRGALLGGEQSGHIIFRDHATTGDALLTAA